MSGGAQIHVRVREVHRVAHGVKRFTLEPLDGGTLPGYSAGAHVVVTMNSGGQTFRNPYSLMGPFADRSTYQISVLKTSASRGGSHFMHEAVVPGSHLTISHPVNLFPIDRRGRKHILIAGGIGITPLMAMAEQLDLESQLFELHYSVRSIERGAYVENLKTSFGPRVFIYRTGSGERLPLDRLLHGQPLGTHLYVCGPARMIEAVLSAAKSVGWPGGNVHAEQFTSPAGGEPFVIRLAKSGLTLTIGPHQSILDAVEAAGVDAPYLCRGGACGQCETAVVAARGRLLHHDHYLTPEEKDAGQKLMICVSRFQGQELVVNL